VLLSSERSLAGLTIEGCFGDGFFRSNFWILWSTMFAFAPWHSAIEFKRYLRRFIHLFPGIKTLAGVLRSRHNQYDDLIAPILAWLRAQGVRFHPGHQVNDVEFVCEDAIRRVSALHLMHDGKSESLPVSARDRVFLTLGSMTEASSLGSTSAPPPRPSTAGSGGLVTFAESAWLLSIVLFHQPHFRDQPEDTYVFWGNGLYPERPGNFVGKPMSGCSGAEILQELAGHLGLVGDQAERLLGGAVSLPCLMPFITSQFMPRAPGDRPPLLPQPGSNFALLGQFAEIPDDVVFTVEYSVRSAMSAVYGLLAVEREVPAVRPTYRNPAVLLKALAAALTQ